MRVSIDGSVRNALAGRSLHATDRLLSVPRGLGSSKSSQKELTEDDARDAKPDSWTAATFDSPHCNHFIAKMTQCRAGAPEDAKRELDAGMTEAVRMLRENPNGLDVGEACAQFTERAPAGMGEVCPGVEWGAP